MLLSGGIGVWAFFISCFMDHDFLVWRRFFFSCRAVVLFFLLLAGAGRAGAQSYGPNLLPAGSFEDVQPTYVPWAGVDDNGYLHGIDGKQLSVDDSGKIDGTSFGSSVVAADLNGDGKPDLVLADSYGFFWFYPNSGTPQKPVFTQAEVIPIWLGETRLNDQTEGCANVVPRIQLVDFNGNKVLDVLAGTYSGKLFHIRNAGSVTQPKFKPTQDCDTLLLNTHKHGVLWCAYLAPFMTSDFGTGIDKLMDLLVGEGTYSANSIYLLRNTGSNSSPIFDETHLQKIIPGMGLEELTPTVIDWNNDGKPDILAGDRTGYLTLFLNTSPDADHLTFGPGTHIKIADQDTFGPSITVSVADLTGNHLPNLLIGRNDGTVLYALNTGKPGAPEFVTEPTPLKGTLPPGYSYTALTAWHKDGAFGAPYEMLGAVNPTLEPGFTFPKDVNAKYALKFWVWPTTSTYFPEHYYPPEESYFTQHRIDCAAGFTVNLNKHYRFHFWVKSDHPVDGFQYELIPSYVRRKGFHGYSVTNPIDCGTSWTEVNDDIIIENPDDKTVTTWSYYPHFHFNGQATIWIADVSVQQKN